MEYKMHVENDVFKLIIDGNKTIEMRLNDEKRSKINIGDYIDFTNRDDGEVIHTVVENLFYYDSFKELYENHDIISLGYSDGDIASYRDMEEYYSLDEQDKYGVVGIKIRVLKNKK